jgi:hypothetical protein
VFSLAFVDEERAITQFISLHCRSKISVHKLFGNLLTLANEKKKKEHDSKEMTSKRLAIFIVSLSSVCFNRFLTLMSNGME